jgi:formate dehydrogenase major subunit
LGTSFGRGGATTFQQDLQNSDCILIMGSNMAECHPVGFQWVMEAKLRGATIIHVDPRFSRTSAVSDLFVPIRAGSDIAFLGGLVNYILENGREFREYVERYTNASTIVSEEFRDTEDLDGLFSGFDPEHRTYDTSSWQYKDVGPIGAPAGEPQVAKHSGTGTGDTHGSGGGPIGRRPPHKDRTLQDPNCVYQLLKKHYARYTPEVVEEACGVPREMFLRVAEMLCDNSGPDRTSAMCYAVGWTQHTVGVQYIRTAAIVQQLLGNIGRPGGGILALRGHASIQGSTDIPTLYNILPGYLPMPLPEERDLRTYLDANTLPAGYWGNMDKYTVSLLKAYWGEHATVENDFCFGYLPRINGDHSTFQSTLDMLGGKVKGFLAIGENPAVGSANSRLHRLAMANLDWLVVRDFVEVETAAFWYDAPEIETGELQTEKIATEVFFMPAAAHTEKDGTFTNTQRLLQWHHQAVEPPGDARSDLWFAFHLGRIIREKLAGSDDERDRPILDLSWRYPTKGRYDEPDANMVLREISGYDADNRALSGYTELHADGSTTCGCWIYSGSFADDVNQPARRKPHQDQTWVAPDWGWAWPANRRIIYNRASAGPDGDPWSERKRYVWWDAEQRRWTGYDIPDFVPDRPPDYRAPEGAQREDAINGDEPFIMQADGVAWLYAPAGLKDGPLPTHYEPQETPFRNPLYGQQHNPLRQTYRHNLNPYNPSDGQVGSEVFPFLFTTYRVTEHHTAGGMSRTLPYLSELQPEMFCEVSPELARERRLENNGWATIVTSRTAIEARVMVTDRMTPLLVQGRTLHQVGLPYHWGSKGLSTGDSANDLLPLALDPNVHIQEAKASTCDIQPGRRPRGPALLELVEHYRRRAGLRGTERTDAPREGRER